MQKTMYVVWHLLHLLTFYFHISYPFFLGPAAITSEWDPIAAPIPTGAVEGVPPSGWEL